RRSPRLYPSERRSGKRRFTGTCERTTFGADCYTHFRMTFAAPRFLRTIRLLLLLCGAGLSAFTIAALAQQGIQPALSPGELVRRAVEHEVAANDSPVKHIFCSHKKTPKGSQTRLYVETNDAMAGMLIAVNDQPLSEKQRQAESDHLTWLMDNPDQL